MIAPNLATRPFLNTRPVWLVTIVAAIIAVGLAVVNVVLYVKSDRSLAVQLAERDRLVVEHRALEAEVREHLAALDKVPRASLTGRVEGLNIVLREHAFSWLGLLSDVERVIPWAVRVIHIAPSVSDDKVGLSLLAVARNRESMLEFMANMIADPSFEEPLPRSEETPEESETGDYTFILGVTYLPGGGGS